MVAVVVTPRCCKVRQCVFVLFGLRRLARQVRPSGTMNQRVWFDPKLSRRLKENIAVLMGVIS